MIPKFTGIWSVYYKLSHSDFLGLKSFSIALVKTRVKQAAQNGPVKELNGVRRTLTKSKLGIQMKRKSTNTIPDTLVVKIPKESEVIPKTSGCNSALSALCAYSDSSDEE